jgi:acetyltransferase-like isoleucine patch superfamily enzyme
MRFFFFKILNRIIRIRDYLSIDNLYYSLHPDIQLGKNVRLHNTKLILNGGKITIGDNCKLQDTIISSTSNALVEIGESSTLEHCNLQTKYGGNIKIGAQCEILEGAIIHTYGGNVTIGAACSINPYVVIYGHGNTTIGNNVLIAGHTMIIPSNHNFGDAGKPIKHQGNTSKGIQIEGDVWIGGGCSILDGVKISTGSIIAAGSVVTKDVEQHSVNAGVPSKKIRTR